MPIEGLEMRVPSKRPFTSARWAALALIVVSAALFVAAGGMDASEHQLRRNLRLASIGFLVVSNFRLPESHSRLVRASFFVGLALFAALAIYWAEVS
jgi:hypothetical protein